MAYRRRQQVGRADTPFTYNYDSAPPPPADSSASSSSASSLATKAIRASSAYRDSSLSSVYEQSALSSPRGSTPSSAKLTSQSSLFGKLESSKSFLCVIYHSTYDSPESRRKTDGHTLQKGLDAIASSLNSIGGTIGNALEEGITAVENRTADIIQETRKIQIRKKNSIPRSQDQFSNLGSLRQQPMPQTHVQPQTHTTLETQLKASRDVAMAMAAKAKLLLRELKTVKADLAFAKERCAQLEEENRFLRRAVKKVTTQKMMIWLDLPKRIQSMHGEPFPERNCQYHQLTMQDVVYLDEGSEEVTEVYPIKINVQSSGTMSAVSPTPTVPQGAIPQVTQNVSPSSVPSLDLKVASQTVHAVNPYVQMPAEDLRRH
ncbi:hypothetical protein DH2020_000752 [Rehmannia glutinosa]|uniref:Uncharacterized protein n=1 Tax=Rehmannia glutinosa TaxID=99300 RepID=A0ABR0XXU0_REHGL